MSTVTIEPLSSTEVFKTQQQLDILRAQNQILSQLQLQVDKFMSQFIHLLYPDAIEFPTMHEIGHRIYTEILDVARMRVEFAHRQIEIDELKVALRESNDKVHVAGLEKIQIGREMEEMRCELELIKNERSSTLETAATPLPALNTSSREDLERKIDHLENQLTDKCAEIESLKLELLEKRHDINGTGNSSCRSLKLNLLKVEGDHTHVSAPSTPDINKNRRIRGAIKNSGSYIPPPDFSGLDKSESEDLKKPSMSMQDLEKKYNPIIKQFQEKIIPTLGSLDKDLRKRQTEKFDTTANTEVIEWICSVLNLDVNVAFPSTDLHEGLKSGELLCDLINAILPGTIKRISRGRVMPFMMMENINSFLKACSDKLSIPSTDLFQTVDLFEAKNMNAVVTSLHTLGRVCASRVPSYTGPVIAAR